MEDTTHGDFNTLIYIRKLKPLSVTFPPPGIYVGRIGLILPDADSSILSRLGGMSSNQTVLVLETKLPRHAAEIRDFLLESADKLQEIMDTISRPIQADVLKHLQLGSPHMGRVTHARLIEPNDPYEEVDELTHGP